MRYLRIMTLIFIIFPFHQFANAYAPYSADSIKHMVVEEARLQRVSPSLALAIAKVESDYNAYALSHAGARGVMQMMPATAKNEYGVLADRLYDPRVNIRLGVRFIKHLIAKYDGRVDIALSHYNGGSRVRNASGRLSVIPATRDYVNKVLRYEREFRAFVASYAKEGWQLAQAAVLDDFEQPRPIRKSRVSAYDKPQDNRIAELQRLRVHNLTRSSARPLSLTTYQVRENSLKTDHEKRNKVRAWEAIFD